MNPIRKSKMLKTVSVFTAISLLTQVFFPTVTWALTSGPSSPEFSSFEPVATTNMVNTFSGDFTYNLPVVNIPGPNGSGYAMSLSYHAGENVESEASWVGYGWTLNPGAINRSKRGIADDSKAENIKYHNDIPANWTASIGASVGGIETFGKDLPISASGVFKYNNYKGFDFVKGIGISLGGMVNLGFSHVDGEGSFSVNVNPIAMLKALKNKNKKVTRNNDEENAEHVYSDDFSSKEVARLEYKRKAKSAGKTKGIGDKIPSSYISLSMSAVEMPTTVSEYKGFSINGSFSAEAMLTGAPVGPEIGLNGCYSQQKYEEVDNLSAYGYMYSGETAKTKYDLMDYYSEKESLYNKRDKYLSIPFSNADQYYLSGEGLSGGFRMYSSEPGHFSPNYKKSGMTSVNIGVEFQAGFNIGTGADVGVGYQSLEVSGNWKYNGDADDYKFPENDGTENYFFRFNNDMGGDLKAFSSPKAIRATVSSTGVDNYEPKIAYSDMYYKHRSSIEGVNRSGRSTYIGYHTNSEMGVPINGIAYNSYEKNASTNNHIDRTSVPNGIGEFTFFNEGGSRYIYGLPVYSKNEKSINYGLKGSDFYLSDNHTVYIKEANFRSKVGQENLAPYATSYLLTEITTPDYIDRTLNGVDDSDFGGYTKFSYNQYIGSNSKVSVDNWYKWRMPYTGLSYSAGSALFKDDDIGSVNSGEKEIYYLDSVQTKTHFAIFHTSDREDGMEASDDDIAAAKSGTLKGTDKLQKLDSICVFAKSAKSGDNPVLVQKVVFDYGYDICEGLPNSSTLGGKLTLQKVWFEHNGIVQAKINPYKFSYTYPVVAYPAEYSDLDSLGNLIDENPDYNSVLTDRWGNYREDTSSINRDNKQMPWVDQTPPENFDPAAWQLKAITLPSGGEIHVQYEADDYRYVQDKKATVMVRIKQIENKLLARKKYYLDVESDLGIISSSDLYAYKTVIENELKDEKIYFKFLYALLEGSTAEFNNGVSDYVDGFVAFHNVDVDDDGLFIEIGPSILSSELHQLPQKVCKDYVNHEVKGKIRAWSIPEKDDVSEGDNGAVKTVLFSVLDFMAKAQKMTATATCSEMNPALSYFRIPVLHSKKGGGLRVKRILMYDKGIETGAKSLYGSEYIYQQEDGESSGVATNEPSVGRYENALIVPLEKRSDQKFWEKITSGKDKDQFEGPLGESILPSPSVGYSRVVVKNIHKGATNSGFTVNEFNTVFDYPFDKDNYKYLGKAVDYTEIDDDNKQILYLPTGLMNTFISNYWVSQGYSFTITNMHGQPKSVKTYGGDYSDPQKMLLSSSQVFEYFEPGEKIPILYDNMVIVKDGDPGMEQEVVFEIKSVDEISNDGNVEGDISAAVLPIPVPFGSAWPSYTYSENKLRTHVTTKITRYPVIQKRVISMQEGIEHITENVAFSRHTGKPVVTRTYDGYHGQNLQKSTEHSGTYTNYNLPASYVYDGMSQKAINERNIITSGTSLKMTLGGCIDNYYIEFEPGTETTGPTGTSVCDALKGMSAGDLIIDSKSQLFHVDRLEGNKLYVQPSKIINTGSISTDTISKIKVIRSGRTNQLEAIASSTTTYGESDFVNVPISQQNLLNMQELADDLNTAFINGSGTLTKDYSLSSPSTTCNILNNIILSISIDGYMSLVLDKDGDCEKCNQTIKIIDNNASFYVDTLSGDLMFSQYSCLNEKLYCFSYGDYHKMGINAIAASATTYDDNWNYTEDYYGKIQAGNDYEKGKKGKWRPSASYTYRENIIGGSKSDTNERNYNEAGEFPLVLFNFDDVSQNDITKWLNATTINSYTPNGQVEEEQNMMGIKSSALFGYKNTMPIMIAQNAPKNSIYFESFENLYFTDQLEFGKTVENPNRITEGISHAGVKSFKMSGSEVFEIEKLAGFNSNFNDKIRVLVWVKDNTFSNMPIDISYGSISKNVRAIAQTGEWTLYEAIIDGLSVQLQLGILFMDSKIKITNKGTSDIYIDDVRMQPNNAQGVCYVYDTKTLNTLVSFDDQHFGLYYQYNAEGKLVRKMVETEKGMKTIQETQYHLPQGEYR